jgi:toxin-antitoxin system PIN domain toxin
MRSLLDVNVLVSLFDEDHVFNERAHEWLAANAGRGIATCPHAENGVVRILSHPAYSKVLKLSPLRIIGMLSNFASHHDHEFWPDEISLRDAAIFDVGRLIGHRQVSDVYLLGLAVRRGGRLVTFDDSVGFSVVRGFRPEMLVVI